MKYNAMNLTIRSHLFHLTALGCEVIDRELADLVETGEKGDSRGLLS